MSFLQLEQEMHSALKIQNTIYCDINNKKDNKEVISWPTFAAVTALLGHVSTSLAHLETEILAHS